MVGAMIDWLHDIPPLRQPRKAKPRKIATPGRYDLRKLYYDARRVMFEREYPAAWKAGEYYDNKFPDVTTTNGTQKYIQDVLNNLGFQAERVNTGGIPMKDKSGQFKMRYSGSTKGSTDLHCIVAGGRAWKIEIKKGADILSGAQEKYHDKVIAAGGLHSVVYVGELDFFWDEYYKIMAL